MSAAGLPPIGGTCRFCRCTDEAMGRDDSGEEAKWTSMARDVCSKPQCQAALRKESRRVKRSVSNTLREAVRPIRSSFNQAAKRKRERREKAAQRRNGSGRQ